MQRVKAPHVWLIGSHIVHSVIWVTDPVGAFYRGYQYNIKYNRLDFGDNSGQIKNNILSIRGNAILGWLAHSLRQTLFDSLYLDLRRYIWCNELFCNFLVYLFDIISVKCTSFTHKSIALIGYLNQSNVNALESDAKIGCEISVLVLTRDTTYITLSPKSGGEMFFDHAMLFKNNCKQQICSFHVKSQYKIRCYPKFDLTLALLPKLFKFRVCSKMLACHHSRHVILSKLKRLES